MNKWAKRFLAQSGPTETSALLVAMTKAVKQSFTYQIRWDGPRTPAETLQFGADRVDGFIETSVEVSVSVEPVR